MSGLPSPRSNSPRATAADYGPARHTIAPVRTLGIDLAAQPANTSVCAIDWGPSAPVVSDLRSGLDDEALLEAI